MNSIYPMLGQDIMDQCISHSHDSPQEIKKGQRIAPLSLNIYCWLLGV